MCTNGGRVYESKVADVKVRSVISGEDSGIGGAVGFANNGSNIENVTVTGGTSSGNDAVVGFDGTPKNTSFANIGGIAGRIQNVFVKNCHVSANVAGDMGSTDGNTGVGGVVGYALTCNISNCTYSGDRPPTALPIIWLRWAVLRDSFPRPWEIPVLVNAI